MGRAIEVDKRLDELDHKVNEILLILDELSKVGTKQENIDIHEETKEKKANDKGNGKGNRKSDNGKSKKSSGDTKDSASSK